MSDVAHAMISTNGIRLNGVEVHTSNLTQRKSRAVPCHLMVAVNPTNQRQALADFRRLHQGGQCHGLHISGVADLDFLQHFPNLLYLELVEQQKVNPRQLDGLSNLRGLRLESPGAGLDFACFPHLEVFIGEWHPDNCHVEKAGELRHIQAWPFKPRCPDLTAFANLPRLEWLELNQTTITSLAGLETLEDLRYFELAYAPKLQSLDALAAGQLGIRELSLSHAKKITSYQPIAALPRLRRLKLSWCAPMPDLRWTRGMTHLDFFSFVETNVENGDLSPILDLPRLRYVGTMDKKHYSHKFNALNELLQKKVE